METTVVNASGERITYDYGSRYSDANRGSDQRKNGDKKKGWQVAEMHEAHHECARLLLLGEKNCDIAKTLGKTEVWVSSVKNSPVVQEKLYVMKAARDAGTMDLSREIRDMAPLAIARLKEVLEEGKILGKEMSASGIAKECNNLLDREIGKPTQRVDTRNVHGHFTLEDIEKIKARAKELAGVSHQIIDVN